MTVTGEDLMVDDGGPPADRPPAAARAVLTVERRPPSGDRAWVLTLLPGFPLVLLVLRVWYLARQDLQTMLLVLQSANPLGLIASLLISLLWAMPAAILLLRALFLMLAVSLAAAADDPDARRPAPSRSWLARAGARLPIWLSVPASLMALLTWQLRFLPALLALALVIAGLEARQRFGPGSFLTQAATVAVPVAAGLLALILLSPAVVQGFGSATDPVTALLLLVPPLVAPLLCGPLPARAARWLLPLTASVLALSTPILIGGDYLTTPVLPRVAVESTTSAGVTVHRGSLVSVDDTFTTLLDGSGRVQFIDSHFITAQVLCFTGPEPPGSRVSVHGWQVEQSVLSWAAPRPLEASPDPRCRGE